MSKPVVDALRQLQRIIGPGFSIVDTDEIIEKAIPPAEALYQRLEEWKEVAESPNAVKVALDLLNARIVELEIYINGAPTHAQVILLQQRIASLEAENAKLRRDKEITFTPESKIPGKWTEGPCPYVWRLRVGGVLVREWPRIEQYEIGWRESPVKSLQDLVELLRAIDAARKEEQG